MIKPTPIRPGDRVAVADIEGEVVTVQTITATRLIVGIRVESGAIERVTVDLGADGAVLAPPTTEADADLLARSVIAGRPFRMPVGRIDMILATALLAGRPKP